MKSTHSTESFFVHFFMTIFLLAGSGGAATGKTPDGDAAISGYDAVAYFRAGQAVKGNESYSFFWHNLTWYFVNGENRALFTAKPDQFTPQYDGYCAWAMTEGQKIETDPEVWKIVDGKLYLNCSTSAHEEWSKDIPGNIKKADTNWAKLNGGK